MRIARVTTRRPGGWDWEYVRVWATNEEDALRRFWISHPSWEVMYVLVEEVIA